MPSWAIWAASAVACAMDFSNSVVSAAPSVMGSRLGISGCGTTGGNTSVGISTGSTDGSGMAGGSTMVGISIASTFGFGIVGGSTETGTVIGSMEGSGTTGGSTLTGISTDRKSVV